MRGVADERRAGFSAVPSLSLEDKEEKRKKGYFSLSESCDGVSRAKKSKPREGFFEGRNRVSSFSPPQVQAQTPPLLSLDAKMEESMVEEGHKAGRKFSLSQQMTTPRVVSPSKPAVIGKEEQARSALPPNRTSYNK